MPQFGTGLQATIISKFWTGTKSTDTPNENYKTDKHEKTVDAEAAMLIPSNRMHRCRINHLARTCCPHEAHLPRCWYGTRSGIALHICFAPVFSDIRWQCGILPRLSSTKSSNHTTPRYLNATLHGIYKLVQGQSSVKFNTTSMESTKWLPQTSTN